MSGFQRNDSAARVLQAASGMLTPLMSNDQDHSPLDRGEALNRVVELARQALRERGLSEDEIDALLSRPTAPEFEN